jgi:hypothetical protein
MVSGIVKTKKFILSYSDVDISLSTCYSSMTRFLRNRQNFNEVLIFSRDTRISPLLH